MAGKSGRLTFSGRQEYTARMFAIEGTTYWLPIAHCELGNHYLMRDERGQIVERTFTDGDVAFSFETLHDAQAAIEAWQAQREKEAE